MYKKEKVTDYVGGFFVGSKDFEVDVFRWRWCDGGKKYDGFLVAINSGKCGMFERIVKETDYYSFEETGSFKEVFCKQYDEDIFIEFVEKLGIFLETVNKGNANATLKIELYIG